MYSTYEAPVARRAGLRKPSERQEEDHHSGRRAQPHRPGHRVRLLLLPCGLLAVGARLRDHHGQLQSGDRLDRLRHLRPALFRAADGRGRAGDRARRAGQGHARRRHRAVRRPDAAQARQHAGRGGRADPRHLRRRHRSGRRPQALPGPARQARPQAAQERDRADGGGDDRGGRRDRLSGDAAALLCAGRARHGGGARRSDTESARCSPASCSAFPATIRS